MQLVGKRGLLGVSDCMSDGGGDDSCVLYVALGGYKLPLSLGFGKTRQGGLRKRVSQ